MRIIRISDLNHSFVGKSLFNGAELSVQDGRPAGIPDHIGLVGPNGCGKSTFLKMLTGEVVPDSWTYEPMPGLKLGVLDQFADIGENVTPEEYLDAVFEPLYETDRKIADIYEHIAEMPEEEQMKAAARANRLSEWLDEREFDRIGKKIDSVLTGLGFTDTDRKKTAPQLSGGMKTKLTLAKLLLSDNDLLVLDEPTNFLDAGYIAWLGDYLSRYRGAFIVISHDRAFLNRISNKTVEIANRKFKVYEGNYDYYVREKARREAEQEKQSVAQEKFIARSEAYIAANSGEAYGGKSRSKATWLAKMLENLERIEHPDEIVKPQFAFRHERGATKHIMTLDALEVGYDGSPVLPPLSLSVERGEKLVFRGFNGIGKTTLFKTVDGDLPPVSGSVVFGEGIVSVFLRQEEDY
ncbi:MAG: ATP-binding cassette domain-containing protein, partial [Clostridiales bacterium]|nr:ATP-binding cassette domain-containing protein [Clostridiales bacterium]